MTTTDTGSMWAAKRWVMSRALHRRPTTVVTVFSLAAGLVVFATPAGASTPNIFLSPQSGPPGTTISITMETPCNVQQEGDSFVGALVVMHPLTDVFLGPSSEFPLTVGQSISHVSIAVPVDAPVGHWVVFVECWLAPNAATLYRPSMFLVTGGPVLPFVKVSKTSGQVGTSFVVSGPCAPPSPGPFASAELQVALYALIDPSNAIVNYTVGTGPIQHVVFTLPETFLPGTAVIAASCFTYNGFTSFAEKFFTVLPRPPAAPGAVRARPGPTVSKIVGPIVVNYATPLNRGAAITKYAATCVSSNGGATRTGVHIGASAAPITVTGATLARRYRCSVQAFNAKGASPAAMSGTITVGAPAQVSSVNATKVQSGRLRVTFRNLTPADANGSPLITPKYTATCKSGIGFTRTGVGAASPIYVGGLLTGQGYTCTVVAHNARGFSAPSDPSWWVTV